jgi:hypothetical protein
MFEGDYEKDKPVIRALSERLLKLCGPADNDRDNTIVAMAIAEVMAVAIMGVRSEHRETVKLAMFSHVSDLIKTGTENEAEDAEEARQRKTPQ